MTIGKQDCFLFHGHKLPPRFRVLYEKRKIQCMSTRTFLNRICTEKQAACGCQLSIHADDYGFLDAINLYMGFPLAENFSSYSVIMFPVFKRSS